MLEINIPKPKLLRFTYTNWHGEEHVYEILPEGTVVWEWVHYLESHHWTLSGQVMMRDKDSVQHRRTFLLTEIRDAEELLD
jgi:hypothetical protein